MKFALINNERTQAEKNTTGICPVCKFSVRAYCGDFNIWHWRHVQLEDCDPWYEPETEWHRNWKNNFSIDWQEVIKIDTATNEKHIADIYNPHLDIVIEFQHSPIANEEIHSRERFYKRLVWVLNLSAKTGLKIYADYEEGVDEMVLKYCKYWDTNKRKQSKKGSDIAALKHEEKELDSIIKKIERWGSKPKNELVIIDWKHKPKRWDINSLPTFLDTGNDLLYLIKEKIPNCSAVLVKPYKKEQFITEFNQTKEALNSNV